MVKIPFSIDYRPQIESGEYKVVTCDDRPVRIISWDKKVFDGRTEIVALVPTPRGDTETVQLYCPDGTLVASSWNEKFKLFIVTPEPELTDFEQAVRGCIAKNLTTHAKGGNVEVSSTVYIDDETTKKLAAELLDLARKQLVEEQYTSDPRKTDLYKLGKAEALKEIEQDPESSYAFKRGVEYGKEEALKDLPRWKKIGRGNNYSSEVKFAINGRYLEMNDTINDVYEVALSDLKKLPKED